MKRMMTAAMGLMVVCGVATADDLNPVVQFSVHDEPVDGLGDTFNGLNWLIRTQSTRADRAMQEFDVTSFAGMTVTSATIRGEVFNNNAGGTFPRTFDFVLYAGNGAADLTDYEIAGITVGNASWATPTPPLAFSFDATSAVQTLIDGGATHIGLKVIGTSSNLFPCGLEDDTDTAILTIEASGGNPCPGDIGDAFGSAGSDGVVDFGDFLFLLSQAGPCGTPCPGDIGDAFGSAGMDGVVDFGDFLYLLSQAGPCP